MKYLLDSNVWVSLLRGNSSAVAARFRSAANSDELFVCSVVIGELLYGCARSAKPIANRSAVVALTAPFQSLPYTDKAADTFATLRHSLEERGLVIGPYDMQIAAIALVNDCTLVTKNTREFARVERLQIENWDAI